MVICFLYICLPAAYAFCYGCMLFARFRRGAGAALCLGAAAGLVCATWAILAAL
ncbi:MAG: hypothetical protein IJP30_03490 [Clostridia bacterium]|nr:hypothetical protein [Clostridia bacterium]